MRNSVKSVQIEVVNVACFSERKLYFPTPPPDTQPLSRWNLLIKHRFSHFMSMDAIGSTSNLTCNDEFVKDGYVFEKDAETGQQIEEMETNCIPFASEAGLQFYKTNVLDDPVFPIRPITLYKKADFWKAQATGPWSLFPVVWTGALSNFRCHARRLCLSTERSILKYRVSPDTILEEGFEGYILERFTHSAGHYH